MKRQLCLIHSTQQSGADITSNYQIFKLVWVDRVARTLTGLDMRMPASNDKFE
jgi:hypothetical protein